MWTSGGHDSHLIIERKAHALEGAQSDRRLRAWRAQVRRRAVPNGREKSIVWFRRWPTSGDWARGRAAYGRRKRRKAAKLIPSCSLLARHCREQAEEQQQSPLVVGT